MDIQKFNWQIIKKYTEAKAEWFENKCREIEVLQKRNAHSNKK